MIKDISQAIISELESLFPNKFQLANPYNVVKNTTRALKDGFGVKIGEGSVDEFNSSVFTLMNRTFDIVLTTGFFASDVTHDSREAAEHALVDQMELTVSGLKQSEDLKRLAVDFDYESDSGVELLESDKLSILTQTITMSIRYKRSI